MVRLMEEDVPRKKLRTINFTEKDPDERAQADIASFDKTGAFLHVSERKLADKRLWLVGSWKNKPKI